jgi:hypothetical protein
MIPLFGGQMVVVVVAHKGPNMELPYPHLKQCTTSAFNTLPGESMCHRFQGFHANVDICVYI